MFLYLAYTTDSLDKSYFTIENMQAAILEIVRQMKKTNWTPKVIFSVNRGGCVPGVYLSHLLSVPHKVIDIQLRDHVNKPDLTALKRIIKPYDEPLIVDDINDTGATLKRIEATIKNHHTEVYYATLIENKSSDFKVDFKGKIIDKSTHPTWVVFPWEKLDY